MIPDIQTKEMLTNNMVETRSFTIEANAVAYRALTSNLYSNPLIPL